jgi:hypothetical protein
MLRPQLKDMYQGGHELSLDSKKKAAKQPPMNASPGELRLWRKLNGMLTEEEKAVDNLEHSKAKSRANLAGKPRNGSSAAPLRIRPHVDILKGEEQREQQLIMGGGGSSPAGSVRNSFGRGKTPTRTKATPQRARDRVVQSPENEASSVQVTGASPKRRPKAPAPVPISVALVPKPQAVGVARPSPGEASSLAQVQAMCGSLRLADKKKLLAWLGGRIEVEELQDLLGDRGGGITGAGEIPHVVHEHEL